MNRNWFSSISNLSYIVPSIFGDWFVRLSLWALTITSGLFHWHEHKKEYLGDQWKNHIGWKWQKADMSSIFFSQLFILGYLVGGGLNWFLLPLGLILSLLEFQIFDFKSFNPDHLLVGVLAFITVAVKATMAPIMAACALGLYILAMMAEKLIDNDFGHGLWHILTATAKTLILI